MFKTKLTDKSLMAVLILLGAVILFLVYMLGVKNINEDIANYKSSNAQLQSTIESLQEYYDHKQQYITDTEALQKEISKIAVAYPSMYLPEDYIMEGVTIENVCDDITYTSINISDPVSLALIEEETVKGANIENLNQSIEFLQQDVTYSNDLDYLSLKQALGEIFASDYCANIQQITYTVDQEDGSLSGDFKLGYYYVTGTGVEYTAPYVPEYAPGTDNIFGHYESEEDEEAEETGSVEEVVVE